jgi:hypothetical protein
MYQPSVDVSSYIGRRGISTSEDSGEEITVEIAKCDAALGR